MQISDLPYARWQAILVARYICERMRTLPTKKHLWLQGGRGWTGDVFGLGKL